MKNLTLMLIIILTLYSCGGFSEAGKVLRNEKVTTTDEFLVKKRILWYYLLITTSYPNLDH